jgi:hypothetical protein
MVALAPWPSCRSDIIAAQMPPVASLSLGSGPRQQKTWGAALGFPGSLTPLLLKAALHSKNNDEYRLSQQYHSASLMLVWERNSDGLKQRLR